MKTILLAAAIAAVALASPASAQQWPYNQQLDNAVQGYVVDQQLNALAAQAMRSNQNAVNQGLNLINPSPRTGCYSFGMRIC
jgi:hypothetical protein